MGSPLRLLPPPTLRLTHLTGWPTFQPQLSPPSPQTPWQAPGPPRCVSLNLSNQTGNEVSLQAENRAHVSPRPSSWTWGSPKAWLGEGAQILLDSIQHPVDKLHRAQLEPTRWGSFGVAEVAMLLFLPAPHPHRGEMSRNTREPLGCLWWELFVLTRSWPGSKITLA